MKTILLDDLLDDGIIREKSFRKMVKNLNMNQYKGEKVIKGTKYQIMTYLHMGDINDNNPR